MNVTFQPLELNERNRLLDALRGNAGEAGGIRLRRNTTFESYMTNKDFEEVSDDEVVTAIRSVPTHY